MDLKGIAVLGVVVVLMSCIMWTETEAQAQSGCTRALTSMSSCLNYVTGSSSSPSASCCSSLSNVVQSSPQCLCSVLNGGGSSSFGFTINQTLALSLPSACKVQTPPVSQCNGPTTPAATTPVESPFASPADSPLGSVTPSASDFPSASGSGSKIVPSTDGGVSDGSTIKVPSQFVLVVLLIASSVSAVTIF
ncbi:hypothetical protein L6164_010070 [Bauhinia variegata]|uniref:Uncharacterized protein n=1 Tax=Bauhinia variegata TaxID=167791 RepID=A0ACB9PN72_BAUVA|nr:hypothetical protein L6164_010070 [Bauhinia variegata]